MARAKSGTNMKRKAAPKPAPKPAPEVKAEPSYDDDGMETLFEAMSIVAVRSGDDAERFFVAQLLDDTVAAMLDDPAAQVNVLYFEKDGAVYTVGNNDMAPVQAIMCEIMLNEVRPGEFVVPPKHLERVERVLAAIDAGEPVPDEDAQPLKKRKLSVKVKAETPTLKIPRSSSRASKSPVAKVSKKTGLPVCVAQVSAAVDDVELAGKHAFRAKATDVVASSKEVLRAVLTQNYKLLKALTTPKSAQAATIFSLEAMHGPGVAKCAVQYAVERNDLKALRMLLAAAKHPVNAFGFAKAPVSALQALDTGKHTSSYSDYNRKALNASRGGKEGLNALLKDAPVHYAMVGDDDGAPTVARALEDTLWTSSATSFEAVALLFPADGWLHRAEWVFPKVCRAGNAPLAEKLLGILAARSGWGFNKLHVQVLGTGALEPFRKVSVLKKANGHGMAPLHLAAINSDAGHLRTLVAELDSSDLEFADKAGWRAVHYAAVCVSAATMRVLLDAKVDVEAKTNQKETPLLLASAHGRFDTVVALLAVADDDNRTKLLEYAGAAGKRALHWAAAHGHERVVARLIDAGATVDAVTADKRSPLMLAAEQGHVHVVTELLKAGANANAADKAGRTPLMYAVMNGFARVAKLLLNAKANANAADTSLNTVAHYAASYGWLSSVELLHDIGAALWSRNEWGYSPMACAALKGRYDVSRFLIEHATEDNVLNFQDASGATMLYLQCKHAESLDEIEFLLTKGADPNVPTLDHLFPLQLVLQRLARPGAPTELLLALVHRLLAGGAVASHADMAAHQQPLVLAMAAQSRAAFGALLPTTDLCAPGPNGEDIWMAATAHDAAFLEALLTAHDGPIPATTNKHGANMLHYIAEAPVTKRVPPTIVQKLVERLNDVDAAFAAVSDAGDVPLMALLRCERAVTPIFVDEAASVELDYAAADCATTALLRLYLEKTRNKEDIVCAGALIDGQRTATTESLLHVVASRLLSAADGSGASRWHSEDVVAIVVGAGGWTPGQIDTVYKGNTPLLLAVQNNHVDGVAALVARGANVNFAATDENQVVTATPLHAGVSNDNTDIVATLLQHGASPSAPIGADRETPLHVAMQRNAGTITTLLVTNGADFCAKNARGLSPLSATVLKGLSVDKDELHAGAIDFGTSDNAPANDVWDFLCVQAGAVSSDTAPATSQGAGISALLAHAGAAAAIGVADNYGRTCLHYACRHRDMHLLRSLLQLSAVAVNQRDTDGRTPLHFAVNAAVMTPEATFDVESLLLQHGADVNAVDAFGYSVLHFAFAKVNLDWHMEHKALSVDEKERGHRKHLAAIPPSDTDPIETVGSLCLVEGLVVTGQDVLGRTSLHLGAATGAIVSVLSILRLAPKDLLEAEDGRGDTALGRAMAHDRKAMVTTLIQEGADIHGTLVPRGSKAKKVSYYFYAVEHSWQGICHLLLNSGYSRRQAVEDAIRTGNFQLTLNLITSLVNCSDKTLLGVNAQRETLLHVLLQQDAPFEGRVRTIAWQLVDVGVAVDAATAAGLTGLHFAAAHGNLLAMRWMLQLAPALLNKTSLAGELPVHFGVAHASSVATALRSLVFFARRKAQMHGQDTRGFTVASHLVDRFADARDVEAPRLLRVVHELLLAKVAPNGLFATSREVRCAPQAPASHVRRLSLLMRTMHIPSAYLRQSLLALLLYHGADTAEVDEDYNTVLHHAVAHNRLEEVTLLLAPRVPAPPGVIGAPRDVPSVQRQVLIKATNAFGQNALHLAVAPRDGSSFENAALVELLVAAGVPTDGYDKQHKTPVDLAVEQPSGILYTALTKEARAPTKANLEFGARPPVATDADAYLKACEAKGLVNHVAIPPVVHHLCDAGQRPTIHVEDGVAYAILMTKVDVQSGQHGVNVFYRMQVAYNSVQDVYVLFTNWGRIGEDGKYQHTPFSDAASATAEFRKIFKSKTGNAFPLTEPFDKKPGKYLLVASRTERIEYDDAVRGPLNVSESAVASALPTEVQRVLEVVTDFRCLEDAASEQHHNLRDRPLADLHPSGLQAALAQLSEIRALLEANDAVLKQMNGQGEQPREAADVAALADTWRAATETIAAKCSRYFEAVPRSDADEDEPLAAFLSVASVNTEIARLRRLLDISETSQIVLAAKGTTGHPLDYCYAALQIALAPAPSHEFDTVQAFFDRSGKPGYKVSQVFSLARGGEATRSPEPPVGGHPTLLWHGTRKTNLMGILNRGLCIAPPEAPVSGYMFGKGIYFADVAAKSLNYCGAPYRIGESKRVHYMLLCDVALGPSLQVTEADYREQAAQGTRSTWALGHTQPDPADTVVVAGFRSRVPLGPLRRRGKDLPYDFAWATKHPRPDEDVCYWSNMNGRLDATALRRLDALVRSDTTQLVLTESAEMEPFHIYGHRHVTVSQVTIDVREKHHWVSGRLGDVACVVTVVGKLYSDSDATYSYDVRGQAEVFDTTPLPKSFVLQKTDDGLAYNEYIVYDVAQVEMRYLVEIEVL
ncbi:Poly(ADPribose) polymerase catalytic domain containing protein [Achlya hypogyna]|uniref:Poly [ADP-ribose] polymerase n=1 Tax=Achlya hypogyna TaxID=1202772 RepID=A0A1V9ZSL7_ACHHY|nr:Poly(ADPribose) polymerase catalytic domain containing protein [Achlya hypogyna]